MDDFFYEIFDELPRQGPGKNESTERAYNIVKNLIPDEPEILDIGCGSGMQTLHIAKLSNSKITAVDNHQAFLNLLQEKVNKEGLKNFNIINASMAHLPFKENQFDLIWSEGSIFIMGFVKGLDYWKPFLKKNGCVVVSEATWFKENIPTELWDFWNSEYPQITTIENNIVQIKSLGYEMIDYFKLPSAGWLDDYYIPLEKRLTNLRLIYPEDKSKNELISTIQREIDIFKKYQDFYGYTFFIMKKP